MLYILADLKERAPYDPIIKRVDKCRQGIYRGAVSMIDGTEGIADQSGVGYIGNGGGGELKTAELRVVGKSRYCLSLRLLASCLFLSFLNFSLSSL
jgi:hypothetical protein